MTTRTQFIRYMLVGLVSNAIIYVGYLLMTRFGIGPKLAMSFLYCIGTLQTFVFNKKWSFRFTGAPAPALVRYATVYAVGYVFNFISLVLLVDKAKLPHQLVQGVMIFVVAITIFIAQRLWVFPQTKRRDMV
jgi:putative flippase GtrA